MKRLAVLVLTALLLASTATAQRVPGEPTEAPPAKTVDDLNTTLLDGLLDRLGAAADQFGSVVEDTADGVQTGAGALARLIGAAVSAMTSASAALASGVGALGIAVGSGLATAFTAVGQALISAISLVAAAIGVATSLLVKAYASLIGSLRPEAMAPGAYMGMTAGAATVSTGAAGWSGWQALRKWGLVGSGIAAPIAGFSRISDDQLLDHPVRNQIFNTIQQHPGIHASQLAREVGVGWGTVSHHLDKLSKASMVTTRKVNNQKCFFEQGGTISRQDMEAASAVKGDTAGAIAGFVHRHPMTSQKDLAEALGISAALASFHVKKLTNLGVLDKLRHGKETLLTTSQSMRRLLEADADLQKAMEQRADEALQYGA